MVAIALHVKFNVLGKGSCKTWNNGFKDSKLINDGTYCKIPENEVCYYDVLNNLCDLSYLTFQSCSREFGDDDLTKIYYKNHKILGFPNTEDWTKKERSAVNLQNEVLSSMIPFESKSEWQNSKIETVLDRTGDHPHVEIPNQKKRNGCSTFDCK